MIEIILILINEVLLFFLIFNEKMFNLNWQDYFFLKIIIKILLIKEFPIFGFELFVSVFIL